MPGQVFIADAMLGSLARKLRIFGYDTKYHRMGTDVELLRIAMSEQRAVVTADRQLGQMAVKSGLRAFVVKGRNDRERIRSLVEEAGRLGVRLEPGEPLCAICNGELAAVRRMRVKGLIPPRLLAKHRAYYLCKNCGKVYWHGSHWRRIRSLELLIRPGKAFNVTRAREARVPQRLPGN